MSSKAADGPVAGEDWRVEALHDCVEPDAAATWSGECPAETETKEK